MAGVSAVPVARADDTLQDATARIAIVVVLCLLAALVHGWTPLVPAAIVGAGGSYGAQLAVDDAPLDLLAPVLAAALLLVAELSYWSLEERAPALGDPGDGPRHGVAVAAFALGALLVGAALLAIVDVVQAESLALDLLGAVAAAAVLIAVLVAARRRVPDGH